MLGKNWPISCFSRDTYASVLTLLITDIVTIISQSGRLPRFWPTLTSGVLLNHLDDRLSVKWALRIAVFFTGKLSLPADLWVLMARGWGFLPSDGRKNASSQGPSYCWWRKGTNWGVKQEAGYGAHKYVQASSRSESVAHAARRELISMGVDTNLYPYPWRLTISNWRT